MLHLAKLMTQRYPHDSLYYNILAEGYAMNELKGDAVQLFDDLVRWEVTYRNIRYLDEILHRAFCLECSQPIRGIRIKCVDSSCGSGDWCVPCLSRRPLTPHPCDDSHVRIDIPSPETRSALRLSR